jgi:hypothetical protein
MDLKTEGAISELVAANQKARLITVDIGRMTSNEKLAEAMRRSLSYLPAQSGSAVMALLKPETLVIITGTLVVWAASHFFGVGEIVDLILLGAGVVVLGFAVFEGADALSDFVAIAIDANSDADLETAGRHFARALTLLGVSTIQAVLLKGRAGVVMARSAVKIHPRIKVDVPPPAGNQLRLSRPVQIVGGALGKTSTYGVITIARNQSLTEQRLTLFHELVHRFLSPRTGPFRQIRAEIGISGYARSALLRYLEEALAEGFAQLRVNGLVQVLAAFRFPVRGGYVTVAQLAAEGHAVGTIVLGGLLLNVSISRGDILNK